jgi:hypothetical protein
MGQTSEMFPWLSGSNNAITLQENLQDTQD